ncbi:MAG: PAS domain S-box protein [Bacteroidota bacterium]
MDITLENNPADMPAGNTSGQEPSGDFVYSNSGFPHFNPGQPHELHIPYQILESLPFPLFIKDLNGTYLACNQHFCDMFGFLPEQIIGKDIRCLFDAESAEIHISADQQLIETGIRVVYETKVSGPEIRYGLVRVIKSPINDEKGKLRGIIGLISEINSGEEGDDFFEHQNADIDAFFKLMSSEPAEDDDNAKQTKVNIYTGDSETFKFENRAGIILKALNAGAWEWNPYAEKLHWSGKCYEIFGMEKGIDKPVHWLSKVHQDDINRVHEVWSRITLKEGWFELEFRILVNSKTRWVKKSGYFIKGNETGSGRVSGVMADITDEKDYSEKLFNSQRLFKAIIEDQSELICRIRPDGTVTFVNRAFARFFNTSADGFLRNLLTDVFPEKDYLKIKKLLKCIKPARQFVGFEQRLNLEEGKVSVVHWTIRAIYNKEDIPDEYQLVGRDETEIDASREALRRSEEMFRLIAENSNDIISIHPEDGTIEYVSPSVKHILGYNPDDLTGSMAQQLVYEEDLVNINLCSKSLLLNTDPVLLTFRLKDYHGNLIWFESMIQRQFNNNGEATSKVIAVSRNIQSRKLVEEQQKQTEQQLKEANLTKDKFFSIIAHDLRSPFTSILGFTRLLNEEYDEFSDEDRKMMVKQIQNSTESTFQLLDNLLAWAKTQLGRTIYNPETFTLSSLVSESIKQTTPQAQIKNISISAGNIEELALYADLNMIRTVLRNLLSNAIKFSFPDGSIEIDTQIDNGSLIISVTDHGTGIPPEVQHKLFSLTEQATTTKGTANEKGTGLGLILCKEFIERNGGTIQVVSKVGKGSVFSISLPIRTGS